MAKQERDMRKEASGWISIAAIMLFFPIIFFLCVFVPIWVGITPTW